METRLSKKRKEAEQTTESSREEQRESIPAAAAKPAGSNEAEESRIGSPRAATNLELPAAEETALPTDVEMGETRRGVRSSRRKLTPSKKKLKNLEIASPLVLGGDGKRQGQTRKDAARSPAAERKRRSRQKSQVARLPQKKATVSPMERKRKSRARQTAEEKEEETKKRRNDRAARDPEREGGAEGGKCGRKESQEHARLLRRRKRKQKRGETIGQAGILKRRRSTMQREEKVVKRGLPSRSRLKMLSKGKHERLETGAKIHHIGSSW